VDSNKCLNCHEIIEGHGGNRVNNVQVCVTCHNPNLSSSGRVVDTSLTAQDQKDLIEAAGYDPNNSLTWPEATQSFKNLIHGLHAAAWRDNAFEFVRNRNNGLYFNWSEVTFPGIISNCETCHIAGTYEPDAVPAGALMSTDVTTDGLNLNRAAVQAARDGVPNDTDLISSKTAGTCAMCHDSYLAASHIGQNGGVIEGWRAEALGN
jgi:OmcA/MtrC family decaheme c-type cytochrome